VGSDHGSNHSVLKSEDQDQRSDSRHIGVSCVNAGSYVARSGASKRSHQPSVSQATSCSTQESGTAGRGGGGDGGAAEKQSAARITLEDLQSGPGGRHDNDHADFRSIEVCPTSSEVGGWLFGIWLCLTSSEVSEEVEEGAL
jgi:hypothetical protein